MHSNSGSAAYRAPDDNARSVSQRLQAAERIHNAPPSDARHLRLVADIIEEDFIIELPGVDAERLRLLASQLAERDTEVAELTAYADTLHRALCEAIEDLDKYESTEIVFVLAPEGDIIAAVATITPEAFSDLAVFLLDEVE